MLVGNNCLLISLLILFFANCSSSSSYLKDRGNDLADILDISLGVGIGSMEAVVYTGEYNNGFGWCPMETSFGIFRGVSEKKTPMYIGAGPAFKILWNQTKASYYKESSNFFRKKELDEINNFISPSAATSNVARTLSPSTNNPKSLNSRIGFKVAFFVSFRVVVCTGEIADFFLGWLGADIYNDDYHKNIDKMKEEL